MPPTVSVIIAVYTERRWDEMNAAITSVKRQTYQPSEIIVVVDHNEQLAERLAHIDGIILTPNIHARGVSGARSTGCAIAQGEIIGLLDDDAVAEPTWLQSLVNAFADTHVIGAGGDIVPAWAERKPRWFPVEFQWVVGCSYRGLPITIAPVRNLIGGNMSFRREVFAAIGGFRSGVGRIDILPIGCEETEWCIRALQALPNSVMLYIPEARTHHYIPGWRATWSYFLRRCFAEGLSKAAIGRFVTTSTSLSSETSYVLQTLPTGIIRVLSECIRDRDLRVLGQMVAIVSGLLATVCGYVMGKLRPILQPPDEEAGRSVTYREDQCKPDTQKQIYCLPERILQDEHDADPYRIPASRV